MSKKTLLIIDDNRNLVDGIEVMLDLQMEDVEVLKAYNGSKGLEIAIRKKPDIILLDLQLPDLDGRDVLKALKKKRVSAQIIMLTGNEDEKRARQLLRDGAVAYMIKPIRPESLIKILNKHWAVEDPLTG